MWMLFNCNSWEDKTNELNWKPFFDKGFSTKEQANFELDCQISRDREPNESLEAAEYLRIMSNKDFKIVEVKINV
tara:strand:- start:3550 stop:3774 length:225 start_codon:yes stop_codon:yes gene_type:complete